MKRTSAPSVVPGVVEQLGEPLPDSVHPDPAERVVQAISHPVPERVDGVAEERADQRHGVADTALGVAEEAQEPRRVLCRGGVGRALRGLAPVAAEVAGLVGQLGRGELGAAFLAGYRYSGAPGRIAAAAGAGIGDYQSTDASTDASAGDLFRGIPPGALP